MVYAKCASFAAAAITCLIAATAASGAPDPRKCDGTPSYCAETAASLAFRRQMMHLTGSRVIWSAPMTCTPASAKLLVWTCDFGAGKGTITFRALSNGWHTRVAVACTDPGMKPATSCRGEAPTS